MRRSFQALLWVWVLSTGCASTAVRPSLSSARPYDCSLSVMNAFPADAHYEKLGTVAVRAGGSNVQAQDLENLMPEMKEAACHLGADALVVVGRASSKYWKLWAQDRGTAEGVAIKVLDSAKVD